MVQPPAQPAAVLIYKGMATGGAAIFLCGKSRCWNNICWRKASLPQNLKESLHENQGKGNIDKEIGERSGRITAIFPREPACILQDGGI